MAAKKQSKNSKAMNKKPKANHIKTSYECQQCREQCPEGKAYIKRMSVPGAKGNGVHCKRV